jgi:RNA recognition motif-containing protein
MQVQMAVASATRAEKNGTPGSLVSQLCPLAQSPENSPQLNRYRRGNVVKNLFVGNLGSEVTHEELRRLFEAYGQVVQVHIIVDRDTGLPRGFAFVEMTNNAEAERAINALNGSPLRDRTLDVNYARRRPERPAA